MRTGKWSRKPDRTLTADARRLRRRHVQHADAAAPPARRRRLPDISPRLGYLTRTNSEALLGAISNDKNPDYTHGVAITSSWHPDENTHIEPVRYGKGSNAMGLLNTADDRRRHPPAPVAPVAAVAVRNPKLLLTTLVPRRWSERVIILLVMQSLNNSITVLRKKTGSAHELTSAGRGRAEPDVDPGRQPGRPPARRQRRRMRPAAPGAT